MVSQDDQIRAELNDVAISLLEQSCYVQAFETFKEAMQHDASGDPDAAKERLENLEPFPKPPPIKYSTVLMSELTTTEKNIDFVFEKLQDDAYKDCFLPVRFGDQAAPGDLQDAIIEYNYGIAHQAYALALISRRKKVAFNNHRQIAIQLLQSADVALEKISASAGSVSRVSKDGTQTLFLRMALLLGLHKEVSGTPEQDEVREKLIEVHARISTMFETLEASHRTVARMHKQHRRGSIDDSQHVETARMA